jgi:hypothetical protein
MAHGRKPITRNICATRRLISVGRGACDEPAVLRRLVGVYTVPALPEALDIGRPSPISPLRCDRAFKES